ncbi:MAG: methyltransferase domain-containing protein, partial [Candidatus Latescibacterota bacterium]
FLGLAVVVPASAALTRTLRLHLGSTPGAYLPLTQQVLGAFASLLPFALLGGLLFQRLVSLHVGAGRTLAGAYAAESAGGLVGGALSALLLAGGAPNLTAGLLCGALACGLSLVPGTPVPQEPGTASPRARRPSSGAGVGLALLALVLLQGLGLGLARVHALDAYLTRRMHPDLAATRDTPYGRITLVEAVGQAAVFVNDRLAFDTQSTAGEELAHLAALQSAAPESVLVLGGAGQGILPVLLSHGPRRLVDVEIDRGFLSLLQKHLPGPAQACLSGGGVEVVVADPRTYLGRAGRFDLIVAAMGEPDAAVTNRYYTREFFVECRQHLRPGGVLAFALAGAENLWTPALARRNASVYRALRAAFPDVLVLPGATNVVLAGEHLGRDPGELEARWHARRLQGRLVGPAYLRYLLTNDRLPRIALELERTAAPANRDSRPVCFQYTAILWLSLFLPALGMRPVPAGAVPAAALLGGLGLVAAVLVARRGRRARYTVLAAVAGFGGMVLESALLLGYQTRHGVLFRDLGLLVTLFMAGLSAGAALLAGRELHGGQTVAAGARLAWVTAGL